MSITEDAPAVEAEARRAVRRLPGGARMGSPWSWVVGASLILLLGTAAVLAVWWGASRETQIASYPVVGTLDSIDLDLGEASVEITGGASGAVEVQRTDEFAFGHSPGETVAVQQGVLRIVSRCPDTVLGTCSTRYRIALRDNVQVNVQTTSGRVRVIGLNASARIATGSGGIAVDGFCGFQLSALSASGDVRGSADCSPDRVQLRSNSGDVHAIVPTGRYRVDANSDGGSARVRNLVVSDDASYAVQAISGSGDVIVDGRK
jgi:Putative adhesin